MVGNYYQRMMHIILEENTLDDISDIYNSNQKDVSFEALNRAINDLSRGNLPKGISGREFLSIILYSVYPNDMKMKLFAHQLHRSLIKDHLVPKTWENDVQKIDGVSELFNPELFDEYILDLLKLDVLNRKAKLKEKKAATREKNKSPLPAPVEKDPRASVETVSAKYDSVLDFSAQFFTDGAAELIGCDSEKLETELTLLSKVFASTATALFNSDSAEFSHDKPLILALKEWIGKCLQASGNKKVLKAKGPLGSYKNRLMQYLYLSIERDLDFVAPVYIDLAAYERAGENQPDLGEEDFKKAFAQDIAEAEKIVAKTPGKKRLLILDGVRDFTCKNESLYYSINKYLQGKDWYLILCMDTDFTVNQQNRFNVHPLATCNYECYLRLRSVSLNRKQKSLDFIRSCIDAFRLSAADKAGTERIYNSLVRLEFMNLDAYWLTYILQFHLSNILNDKNDISGLYEAICLHFLGSYDLLDSAAEFAFHFEFGNRAFIEANARFDLRWGLIKMHRSILDFLIAKHYARQVLSFDLTSDEQANAKHLKIFDMVVQCHIARFAFPMLVGNEDYEHKIMKIATKHYDQLSLIGKSELTFRMTGLKSRRRYGESITLIKKYLEKERKFFQSLSDEDTETKKDSAFLLRSLYINLIYAGDRDAFLEYFDLLLRDKMANSINRGFHLEYYGDKIYIPNRSLLDYEDDVAKGYHTFDKLCLVLDTRIQSKNPAVFAAAIEIISLCNLIQARIEQPPVKKTFNVMPYVNDCLRYLKWIRKQSSIKECTEVASYLKWLQSEMTGPSSRKADEPLRHFHATAFNQFSRTSSVDRAGWKAKGLPKVENAATHMYNCWLMGTMYLPERDPDPDYDKNVILQIILLHDLVEAITGNADRSDSNHNPKCSDAKESLALHCMIYLSTYPGAEELSKYLDYWRIWESKKGINYQIAKDINELQAIYQFCVYYLEYPDNFTDEDLIHWLSALDNVETTQCKKIAETLITNNPMFQEIVEKYKLLCEI